jgi:MFS family permease
MADSSSRDLSAIGGLAAVCLGISASIIPGFLLGSLFVHMGPDLGYAQATSGMLVALFFAASVFLSAPLGRVADRRGPRITLSVALIASFSVQMLVGIFGTSVGAVALLAVAAGVANALNQVSANVWIARHVPQRRQGIAFALKQSSMPAGALAAGLSLPILVEQFGWRSAFFAGALLALVALVALTVVAPHVRPADHEQSGVPSRRREGRWILVSLAFAVGLASAAAVTLGSFFVNSAVESGFSAAAAGGLLAAGSVISIASRLGAGMWADRRVRASLLGAVAAMLALGATAYVLLGVQTTWAHVLALPLAFGAGWAWPGVYTLAVVRINPDRPGRATGVTQSGTYFGASLGPLVFGVLVEQAGYEWAWGLAALLSLSAAAAVLNTRRIVRATPVTPAVTPSGGIVT